MLEKINLKDNKLTWGDFQKELPSFQRRLYELEKACWDEKIPSIVVFEGWDAAGKGSAIRSLSARLDPRGARHYSIQPPRKRESRPWLYPFWLRIPNQGEMAIFEHSWYWRFIELRVAKKLTKIQRLSMARDILEFERMLAEDGTAIIKFWLHIDKKEQKRRFEEIEADPLESWRIGGEDWKRHKSYEAYLKAAEEILQATETPFSPWNVVDATSKGFAQKNIFETLIHRLEDRLGSKAPLRSESAVQKRHDREIREAQEESKDIPKPDGKRRKRVAAATVVK